MYVVHAILTLVPANVYDMLSLLASICTHNVRSLSANSTLTVFSHFFHYFEKVAMETIDNRIECSNWKSQCSCIVTISVNFNNL